MKAILCTGLKAAASAVVFDWYWIDDKVCFQAALFMFVFPFTQTRDKQGAPIITVPVG